MITQYEIERLILEREIMRNLSVRISAILGSVVLFWWAGFSNAAVITGAPAEGGVVKIYVDYNYCSMIDLNGKSIDTSKYEKVGYVGEGMVAVKKNGLWGFIDTKGNELIKPMYEDAYQFKEGLAAVQTKSGKWGFIDKAGRVIIKPQYEAIKSFSEGLAAVTTTDRKIGFIDQSGSMVIPPSFSFADEFKEGVARVSTDNRDEMGYVDRTGKFVIQPHAYVAQSFSEGFALIEVEGQGGGFIDKTGKIVVQPRYKYTSHFHNGLAKVTLNGLTGYIDQSGSVVIPLRFEEARNFSEGLAPAKIQGKWGLINTSGEFILTPKYEDVGSFSDGLALVQEAGTVGYASPNIKWVISPDDVKKISKPCIAKAEKAKADRLAAENAIRDKWRKNLKEGDSTNCGPVLEIKTKLVKVAFPVANYGNEHWIRKDQIMPSIYGCEFVNGQYQPQLQ